MQSTYMAAVRRENKGHTPIWIMRQAGRYLPEYRALREKHDFLEVCKTPELATEVTLQPLRRFPLDAAILFSDILVIPEALGMNLTFAENHGPRLQPPIRSREDLQRLNLENLENNLSYVAAAVKMLRGELADTPLIGFSGSPFTLAVYMIEGKPTRNFQHIKTMLYRQPELLRELLQLLQKAVSRYLQMQIDAGAQAVQIFDTWGGILPPHLFAPFSADFMQQIVADLAPSGVPVVLFAKGGSEILPALSNSQAAMLGIDWMTDIAAAKKNYGKRFALQGNLDPTILYGEKEIIAGETERILTAFSDSSGHVFNLGHGILPDIPVENVAFLVDHVHAFSARLRQGA
jgi:uroporphyrinogen decarboxylase